MPLLRLVLPVLMALAMFILHQMNEKLTDIYSTMIKVENRMDQHAERIKGAETMIDIYHRNGLVPNDTL